MDYGATLLAIGGLLLAALALDYVGRRTGIPRVSLLVAVGIVIGPAALDLVPETLRETTDFTATLALVMVAFLLGGDLALPKLKQQGRKILIVSGLVVLVTALFVAGGLMLVGLAAVPAILLAAIATATDPAATRAVVVERGIRNRFVDRLLGIVAIDDAWGLIVYGIAAALATAVAAGDAGTASWYAIRELGGALLLGVAVGFPAAYLTGRIRAGSPSLIEGLGVVLVAGGTALLLDVSYLLTAIIAGAIVANFAKHHEYSFREIEHLDEPILILFFVLAGASLDFASLAEAGLAGAAFIAFRVLGRVAGGWIGGSIAGLPPRESHWTGAAMLPQAGVALGMALVAARDFPEFGDTILAVAIGATVVFELFGPIATRIALIRTGGPEDRSATEDEFDA